MKAKIFFIVILICLSTISICFAQTRTLKQTLDYINETLDANPEMIDNATTHRPTRVNYSVSISSNGMLQVRKASVSMQNRTCSYVSIISPNDIDTAFHYYYQQTVDSPLLKHIYISCKCDTVSTTKQLENECQCVKAFYDKANSNEVNCPPVLPYYPRIEIIFGNKDGIELSLLNAFTNLAKLLAGGTSH